MKPLAECVARPPEDDRTYPLVDHLVGTAKGCGDPQGTPAERLAFLAGLLHDAGKAHLLWQERIGERAVPHSPFGAYLFAFCAERLIPAWEADPDRSKALRCEAMRWTAAIYDHHGAIHDMQTEPPWVKPGIADPGQESQCLDVIDLLDLVREYFPELDCDASGVAAWATQSEETWQRQIRRTWGRHLRCQLSAGPTRANAAARLAVPRPWQILVQADRYHAMDAEPVTLDQAAAMAGVRQLRAHCEQEAQKALDRGANPELVAARQQAQDKACGAFALAEQERFFTFPLPTGYGKTLTSVRVALEAVRLGLAERVVYVAPYLSILAQATNEIAKATGLDVVQHHHLSIAEIEDDSALQALDTWQSPVVTTTFNQLFRAILPKRSHQTLRAAALRRAFVIVDEPQIIDVSVWNLFLCMLRATAEELDFRVGFATATLPPTEHGLGYSCTQLTPDVKAIGRFDIVFDAEPRDASMVADLAAQALAEHKSVAVVLNTVRDAAEVFAHCQDHPDIDCDGASLFALTGRMLPGHKAAVIAEIRDALKRDRPTLAVCTQVLEAGVDLSFRCILRALPIVPSVAQVAGRANRHGEGERAQVIVFPVVRDDGSDLRRYVYQDETARRHTDALLRETPHWSEERVAELVDAYYQRCTEENRQTAVLEDVERAALGEWSCVGGREPFGSSYQGISLFVPRHDFPASPAIQRLLEAFAPEGPHQLLVRALDRRWMARLGFHDRKRFAAVLHTFVVSVPEQVASECGHKLNDWLWEIDDPEDYDNALGLAGKLSTADQESDSGCLIIGS